MRWNPFYLDITERIWQVGGKTRLHSTTMFNWFIIRSQIRIKMKMITIINKRRHPPLKLSSPHPRDAKK